MEKKLSNRAEVSYFLNCLPNLDEHINCLTSQWNKFYFGSITPFNLLNVTKEDFIYFHECNPNAEIYTNGDIVNLKIGVLSQVILRCEIDYELYHKYIIKKK